MNFLNWLSILNCWFLNLMLELFKTNKVRICSSVLDYKLLYENYGWLMNIIVAVCGQFVLLVSVTNHILLRSVLNADDRFPKWLINLETYLWNLFITEVSINYYIFNSFYMSVCEIGTCNLNLDYYLIHAVRSNIVETWILLGLCQVNLFFLERSC